MENELKPCPFCKSNTAYIEDYPCGYPIGSHTGWLVACGNETCEARSGPFATKEDAIDAWNLRAEPESEEQQLCHENENFIQNKFGYCFYSLGPCPLIYNLYVHPQYRRKGHSSKRLMFAISEIRKSGYNGRIYIQAEPKENSISKEELTQYYEERGLVIYNGCKSEIPNEK